MKTERRLIPNHNPGFNIPTPSGTARIALPRHSDFNIMLFDCCPGLYEARFKTHRPVYIDFVNNQPIAEGDIFIMEFTVQSPVKRHISLTCCSISSRELSSFGTYLVEARLVDAHPDDMAALRANYIDSPGPVTCTKTN